MIFLLDKVLNLLSASSLISSTTVLQVGYPENLEDLKDEIVDKISLTEKKKDELLQVVRYYKKMNNDGEISNETEQIIRNVVAKTRDIICEIDQLKRSFNRLKKLESRKELDTDMVIVSGYAYQGVKIEINGASLRIKDGFSHCIYKKESEHCIMMCSR